ncbi:hypothetical protein BpHYR1_054584 [Brachionus plicatilis]|uniref:Flavodoxin-like domain-containing protein n=1 Tax=Brachionus plicatilis TaxID=10195 RepID=A0A3M7Q1Q0_BRAPC|nr:hypothetical protein BpHYR1_054584 [Brachionus plicatilis]
MSPCGSWLKLNKSRILLLNSADSSIINPLPPTNNPIDIPTELHKDWRPAHNVNGNHDDERIYLSQFKDFEIKMTALITLCNCKKCIWPQWGVYVRHYLETQVSHSIYTTTTTSFGLSISHILIIYGDSVGNSQSLTESVSNCIKHI